MITTIAIILFICGIIVFLLAAYVICEVAKDCFFQPTVEDFSFLMLYIIFLLLIGLLEYFLLFKVILR